MTDSTVFVTCVALVPIIGFIICKSRRPTYDAMEEGEEAIPLLSIEATLAALNISTLTWFRGDSDASVPIVQNRINAIVKKNPWLTGRVAKLDGKYVLIYNPMQRNDFSLTHVSNGSNTEVHRNLPLEEYGRKLSSYLVTPGPSKPVWKISIVPCARHPTKYFAVVVSMSHAVGDGYTFYAIHNMLLSSGECTAMVVQRIPTAEKVGLAAMGEEEFTILQSGKFFAHMIKGVLQSLLHSLFWGNQFHLRYFIVDSNKMTQQKSKAATLTVPFVSTNDVIVSWFFANTNSTFCLMALNFRNRFVGHFNSHAGNYEGVITYMKGDYETPDLIRKSLATFRRASLTKFPSYIEAIQGRSALISNWSTFAGPNIIEGATEELHLPVYNIVSWFPYNMTVSIIFRSGHKKTAVMIAGYQENTVGLMKQASFESVDAFGD